MPDYTEAEQYEENRTFGPSSAVIDVASFIQNLKSQSGLDNEAWEDLDPEAQRRIEAEFGLDDLKSDISNILGNPKLNLSLQKYHDDVASRIVGVEPEVAAAAKKRTRKKKGTDKDTSSTQSRAPTLQPESQDREILALKERLDGVQLKSWSLTEDASFYVRKPRQDDRNSLNEVKKTTSLSTPPRPANSPTALITLTNYCHSPFYPFHLHRGSQQIFQSHQTLGGLSDCLPCLSNFIPDEEQDDDQMDEDGEGATTRTKYSTERYMGAGGLMNIENVLHGDGTRKPDYAERVLSLFSKLHPKEPPPSIGSIMHDTPFSSLKLRLHKPYWFLHQGDCEHFIVFDQIRLQIAADPSSNYPLTAYLATTTRYLCRICSRLPASLSIVGDIRLGESPCLVCSRCWKSFGQSGKGADEGILIAPLIVDQALL